MTAGLGDEDFDADPRTAPEGFLGRYRAGNATFEDLRWVAAEYENAITWGTSCLGCARLLDSCHAETVRAEASEAEVTRLREALLSAQTELAMLRKPVSP